MPFSLQIPVSACSFTPDIEDVCAYYNRDAGISGVTQELFYAVKAFFEEYKSREGDI